MNDPYVTTNSLTEKTSTWLKAVSPYNKTELELNSASSALMVIDMQYFFLEPSSPAYTSGGTAIMTNVKRLIETFREAGRPIIFTKHVHHPDGIDAGIMKWWWEGMCIEGSPESEIHCDIAPIQGEKVIKKHRYSAFYNTALETILRCQKIEDLIITGVMTNMCCESTARDAYFRDYRVFIPADANGTVNEEMHMASLLNLAYGFAVITETESIISRFEKT